MEVKTPQLESGWLSAVKEEFEKDYFIKLKQFLLEERANNLVFPPGNLILNPFTLTPFEKVNVVII